MASTIVQTGPYVSPGDVVKVVIYGYAGNQLFLNNQYLLGGTVVGAGITCGDIAKYAEDGWVSNLQASQFTAYQFLGARAQIVSDTPLLKAGVATDTAMGLAVNGLIPTNTAPIVELRTGLAGRSGRGRNYMPPPDQTFVDPDGSPAAGYVANAQSAVAHLLAPSGVLIIGAGGGEQTLYGVIYHRKTKTTDRITGVVGLKKFGQQHRRGQYGRPNVPYIPL